MGQAAAQQPHDSQLVCFQFGPNGARMVVRTPFFPVCSVWLRACVLHAATQRWHLMHRFGSKLRNGLLSNTGLRTCCCGNVGSVTPSSRQTACSSQAPFFIA